MSASYTSILWNRNKKVYDLAILLSVLAFLILFFALNSVLYPSITFETLFIRAFGWLAIVMLQIILVIGPLARLDSRFNIILYNRRHLGVSMFIMGSIHGIFSILNFHSLSDTNPVKSVFLSNLRYDSILYFPYQTLGFVALIILGLMAVSSHDFWLKNLGIRTWKALHMLVYLAYGLLILHIVLGGLQNETHPLIFVVVLLSFLTVASLHLVAGNKERQFDKNSGLSREEQYIFACHVSEIEDSYAKVVTIGGERVAVFRYGNNFSAVSNICRHQGGPLGEGKIIDGCITCPWHGYQYLPQNGQSPPPFEEKVETYNLKIVGNDIFIDVNANPPGTHVEPKKMGS